VEKSRKKIDGIQKQLDLDASTKPKNPPVQLTPSMHEITLAVEIGKRQAVPVLTTMRKRDGNCKSVELGSKGQLARKIFVERWHAHVDLLNGVRLTFQIVPDSGGVTLIMNARRES
jgi:hypothetical protein